MAPIRRRFSGMLAVSLLLVLAACSSTISRSTPAEQNYGRLPPIVLDVAAIEINETYQPPLKEPHVEHSFPTPPDEAFRKWVGERLKARGEGRTLRITINEASAVRVPLEAETGLSALFTKEQVERIDARLGVLMEILDGHGLPVAHVSALSERSRTLPEGLTLNDRDQVYREITIALINDLNTTIEQNLREHLANYVKQ